jgi:hypothetical protein
VGFKVGDQEIGLDPNGHKIGLDPNGHKKGMTVCNRSSLPARKNSKISRMSGAAS